MRSCEVSQPARFLPSVLPKRSGSAHLMALQLSLCMSAYHCQAPPANQSAHLGNQHSHALTLRLCASAAACIPHPSLSCSVSLCSQEPIGTANSITAWVMHVSRCISHPSHFSVRQHAQSRLSWHSQLHYRLNSACQLLSVYQMQGFLSQAGPAHVAKAVVNVLFRQQHVLKRAAATHTDCTALTLPCVWPDSQSISTMLHSLHCIKQGRNV